MNALFVPVLLLLSSVPMFVVAVLVARGNLHLLNGLDADRLRHPQAVATRMSRLLGLVGVVIVAAAFGMYWAGGNEVRVMVVTGLLLLLVNGLAMALFVAVAAARRDYLPPGQSRQGGRHRDRNAGNRPS